MLRPAHARGGERAYGMADPKQNIGAGATGERKDEPVAAAIPPMVPTRAVEPRRGALKALVVLGSVGYGAAIAVPAVQFVTGDSAGSGGGKARWIRVGRMDDLPDGEPKRWQVVGDERDAFTITRDQTLGSVWVIREKDKVRAMSATCPHLGCSIDAGADKKSFACPCHTSKFAFSGKAEAGPSPRDMDPLQARVVDGWVEVDFRKFRIGVAERQET